MDNFWYILTSTALGVTFIFLTVLSDKIMVTDKHDDEKRKMKKSTGFKWEVEENSIFLEFDFLTASAKKSDLWAKLSVHNFRDILPLKGVSIYFRS